MGLTAATCQVRSEGADHGVWPASRNIDDTRPDDGVEKRQGRVWRRRCQESQFLQHAGHGRKGRPGWDLQRKVRANDDDGPPLRHRRTVCVSCRDATCPSRTREGTATDRLPTRLRYLGSLIPGSFTSSPEGRAVSIMRHRVIGRYVFPSVLTPWARPRWRSVVWPKLSTCNW